MSKVTLKNVYKTYPGKNGRDVTALRALNIEIADREFMVFVGPPGCGKSTVLRMVAGLEEISRGDIHIGDSRVNDIPAKDRDTAMVYPDDALFPHMSVFDNMALGLKLRKFSKAAIRRRVDEAAVLLGLEPLLDRKPTVLSADQRQRVAVGSAIVRQPKVFLFDEPFSNLDAKMRVQMRTEFIKLHQRLQATMIYATHDQVEALTMGSRIVVMNAVSNPETGLKEGVIQQVDTPLNIYNRPANVFVAGFLGSPPMNFLQGTLRRDGDDLIFREARGGAVELNLGGRPAAQAYAGREVTLGLRPENCLLAEDSKPRAAGTFQTVVDVVEPMGAETLFHLDTGAHTIISRSLTSADQREAGLRRVFRIEAEKTHLFDPSTGTRIAQDGEA